MATKKKNSYRPLPPGVKEHKLVHPVAGYPKGGTTVTRPTTATRPGMPNPANVPPKQQVKRRIVKGTRSPGRRPVSRATKESPGMPKLPGKRPVGGTALTTISPPRYRAARKK